MLLDKTNNALPNILDTNVSNPTTFSSMSGGGKRKRNKNKSKKVKKSKKNRRTKKKN